MNLHPSGCPVTPFLLRRFLADMENAPCPGDLSACLNRIEQLARQEEPLCLDLSGSWDFCMSAADDAVFSGETVRLPGTMDENGKGTDNRQCLSTRHLNRDFVYTGPAAYRRSFHLPAHWSGRPVMLELERTKKSRVLLDGVPAGPRQTSYTTPHRYDLSALCRPGENHTLTIEVDNSAAGMPHAMYSTLLEGEAWSHQITEHTQTNWNGIIGRLQLTAPPVYAVSSLTVRPDLPARRARLCAVLARPAACEGEQLALVKIQARCLTADHRTEPQWLAVRFAAGQATVSLFAFHSMGAQPLLWDEFHPNRYRLTLHLYTVCGGQLRETEACADFGMRRFTAAPHDGGRQFFINGRPTLLRGEINCAVFPQTGCCPTDPAAWLRLFQIYKDYGLNHVRFHTWVPPRAAFQAADQLGLYLYVELPQWGRRMFGDVYQGDCSDADYYKNEVRRIFAEYGNSPSFVMFALGNEERIGFYYYEEFLQYCRELEPELLYSDIAGHSTYPPSADFAAKFLDPAYLPLVTPGNDWDYTPAVSSAPIAITGHEVGQLQVYPDYDTELPRYETAVLKPRNLEYFQGVLAQAGLSGRSADFSAATGRLAAMLYRYFTESYLRTPGAGGFTLLGLQDFPGQGTALVGLLDAFAESKGAIAPQVFRRSCCELPVLARMARFVWSPGERFCAEILVPNYSAADACMDVHWALEQEDGTTVAQGCFSQVSLTQGTVTRCGHAEALLPDGESPCVLFLRLRLSGACAAPGAPLVNNYRLWVLPAQAPTAPAGLCLTRSFDDAACRALQEGKTVLILSEGTPAALPRSRAVSFRPDFWSPMFHTDRPDGYLLGVWIDREHPLFRRFPTDLFADWQWYEPLQDARGLLINDLPAALRPIVQPIATVDLPDRLALLLEARVGAGRVFVCTVDLLQKQDAASRQLLRAIYAYLTGSDFSPQVSLSPDELRRLLPPLDLTDIGLSGPDALRTGESARCIRCAAAPRWKKPLRHSGCPTGSPSPFPPAKSAWRIWSGAAGPTAPTPRPCARSRAPCSWKALPTRPDSVCASWCAFCPKI